MCKKKLPFLFLAVPFSFRFRSVLPVYTCKHARRTARVFFISVLDVAKYKVRVVSIIARA